MFRRTRSEGLQAGEAGVGNNPALVELGFREFAAGPSTILPRGIFTLKVRSRRNRHVEKINGSRAEIVINDASISLFQVAAEGIGHGCRHLWEHGQDFLSADACIAHILFTPV
jgi:hypothetical protein